MPLHQRQEPNPVFFHAADRAVDIGIPNGSTAENDFLYNAVRLPDTAIRLLLNLFTFPGSRPRRFATRQEPRRRHGPCADVLAHTGGSATGNDSHSTAVRLFNLATPAVRALLTFITLRPWVLDGLDLSRVRVTTVTPGNSDSNETPRQIRSIT